MLNVFTTIKNWKKNQMYTHFYLKNITTWKLYSFFLQEKMQIFLHIGVAVSIQFKNNWTNIKMYIKCCVYNIKNTLIPYDWY